MKVTRLKFKDGVFAEGEEQSVSFGVGMEFARTFKAADQPFLLAKKYADAVLRSNEHFEEVEVLVLSVDNSPKFSKTELVHLANDQKIEEPEKLSKLPLIKKILGIAEEEVENISSDPNQTTDTNPQKGEQTT